MKTQIETLSPSDAKALLEKNHQNRSIRPGQVGRYADDMKGGLWQVNGQAIIVAEDGTLIDGQHRLQACVSAGVSFKTLVIRGADAEIRRTVDTGRSRTVADILSMHGFSNPRPLASIAAMVFNMAQTGNFEAALGNELYQPTPRQLIETVEHFSALPSTTKTCSQFTRFPYPTAIAALKYLMMIGCAEEGYPHFVRFLNGVLDGACLEKNDPVYLFRRQALERTDAVLKRRGRKAWMATLLKAWNMSVRGETCEILTWKTTETFPYPMLFDEERFTEYATRPSKAKPAPVPEKPTMKLSKVAR